MRHWKLLYFVMSLLYVEEYLSRRQRARYRVRNEFKEARYSH